MADIEDNFEEFVVNPAIRYLRTYTAKVIDNRIGEGRLKLSCEELGWGDEFSYAEASPRDNVNSRILPEIGDYVELSFHAGKSECPKWGCLLSEIKANNKFKQYSKETDRILYEDRKTGDYIKYDSVNKELTINITGECNINGQNINLNGNSESFLTYAALNTAFQSYNAAINLLFASKLDGVGLAGGLSLDISASETTTIKTGG